MRIITCEFDAGTPRVAVIGEDNLVYALNCGDMDMTDFIRAYGHRIEEAVEEAIASGEGVPLESVHLLAPIPCPNQDIICLGLNYADHVSEAKKFDASFDSNKAKAVYFSKRASYCPGHGGEIPSHSHLTCKLDYEVELGVIIGKDAFRVSYEETEDYIFGYTIINDVSAREIQTEHTQWYFGKSLDGFTPMGPCIVTKDEVSYPPKLEIKSFVNGELRQNSTTDNLIHDISEIISELSSGMTLKAGTVIATGTPEGVGMGMNPPAFLKPGDVVTCYIEGIGELKNTIV